jgi:hypothetical protein
MAIHRKKTVAFLGDPWVGSVRRFEAFISQTDLSQYRLIYVLMPVNGRYHKLEYYPVGYDYELRQHCDFSSQDVDLLITLNDKHWQHILDHYAPDAPNLVDKTVLNNCLCQAGLDYLQTGGFQPNDWVFVKPRLGAGQYTTTDFCYRKLPYDQVTRLNLDQDIYAIQEYIDCPRVISTTFVSDGRNLEFIDVTQAYHMTDHAGANLNTHLETHVHMQEKYVTQIALARQFITHMNYVRIPGIYMTQFIQDHRGTYLMDFNVRTGPGQDRMTVERFIVHRIHAMIPFMMGDRPSSDFARTPELWRIYQERDGQPVSPLVADPDRQNRMLVVDNKTSGLIRSDYNTFVERRPYPGK